MTSDVGHPAAQFIAHARTDLPKALEIIRRLQEDTG